MIFFLHFWSYKKKRKKEKKKQEWEENRAEGERKRKQEGGVTYLCNLIVIDGVVVVGTSLTAGTKNSRPVGFLHWE